MIALEVWKPSYLCDLSTPDVGRVVGGVEDLVGASSYLSGRRLEVEAGA